MFLGLAVCSESRANCSSASRWFVEIVREVILVMFVIADGVNSP